MKRLVALLLSITFVALVTTSAVAEEEAHPPHNERREAASQIDITTTNVTEDTTAQTFRSPNLYAITVYVHAANVIAGANYAAAVQAAEAQAAAEAARVATSRTPRRASAPRSNVSGPCGGATNGADQYIGRESGGNPNAQNPRSSAWGCYQIIDSTWNSSCSDIGTHGAATPTQQAQCASRLPLSAWNG